MKVRIEFPPDLAKERAEEAKDWQPGQPMIWEAEEYNVKETVKKVGEDVVLKTPHTEVVLHKDEIERIRQLFK